MFRRVQWKTQCTPRLHDQTRNDRVLFVCICPVVHGNSTGRLSRDDYFLRAASKGGDVVADPFDCEALVAEAGVLYTLRSWSARAREAEDIGAVVYGDDDDVFGGGEVAAVPEGGVCIAAGESFNSTQLVRFSFRFDLIYGTYGHRGKRLRRACRGFGLVWTRC